MTKIPTDRTSLYLTAEDKQRLRRLKQKYGLGTSAACRAGLALLEEKLSTADTAGKERE